MRTYLLTALAVLTLGILNVGPLSVSAANANWQEAILGNKIHSNTQSGSTASQTTKAVYNPGTSKKKKKSGSGLVQKASLTSSGGWGSSLSSSGIASYYWQPQRVASGGWFNPNAMTAAHKTLPFGTKVRVTNLNNGRTVDVTINDRGPFVAGRVIDLSSAAAGVIGMKGAGLARVNVAVLGR